ncbi:hypothetical protein MRX96_006578 [Rhipicephalus microplus]
MHKFGRGSSFSPSCQPPQLVIAKQRCATNRLREEHSHVSVVSAFQSGGGVSTERDETAEDGKGYLTGRVAPELTNAKLTSADPSIFCPYTTTLPASRDVIGCFCFPALRQRVPLPPPPYPTRSSTRSSATEAPLEPRDEGDALHFTRGVSRKDYRREMRPPATAAIMHLFNHH